MLNRRTFLKATAAIGVAAAVAPPAAAQSQYIQGVDVSDYQGTVNWATVAGSGRQFAFAKATEGTTFTASTFAANWAGIKNAQMIRGAYHYARPSTDPVRQARFFYRTVKPTTGDLQLVCDIETMDGLPATQVLNWTQRFLFELRRLCGRPGILYTYPDFWINQMGNPAPNWDCPLWFARYGTSSPNPIPTAWGGWTFWQFSSTLAVPGIAGGCDANAYSSTLTQLNKLRLP